MEKKSFKKLIEAAKKSDEYWITTAILDFTEEVYKLIEGKLKKSDLAKALGVSPAYISKILRGNANFTIETMVRLARAAGGQLQIHITPNNARVCWVYEFDVERYPEKISWVPGIKIESPTQITAKDQAWNSILSKTVGTELKPGEIRTSASSATAREKGFVYASA